MRRFNFMVGAILFLLLGSAFLIRAQQANRVLVIEGAKLIDGTGRPPIENAVIVIADDKIQQVFQKGERGYPCFTDGTCTGKWNSWWQPE